MEEIEEVALAKNRVTPERDLIISRKIVKK